MKVFITGASGRIGTHTIPHLLARGHTVTGLVRSQASADIIIALGPGVTPLIGTLSDRDLLTEAAKTHDAIIHTAMDHSDMSTAAAVEHATLALFADAIEGTGKPLIMSSGTAFLQPGEDETARHVDGHSTPRAQNEMDLLNFKNRGIRSISVRLAMNTHNPEKMHAFEGLLIQAGDKLGYIPYVGDKRWSACNAVDAGLLYVLAMEKAEPGTAVHAVEECIKVKDIAGVLSKKTGQKIGELQEADKEKLKDFGWLTMLLQVDQQVDPKWTRETFGWDPKGQRLLAEMEAAGKDYFGVDSSFGK
ncbi:hypothetical protein P7C73_g944, partial [Tremellales sp. Uapishka_1]